MQNKSIVQSHFSSPYEALALKYSTLSSCPTDKIRVRVEAANINPSDLLSIHGEGQYKHNHQPPRVPGFEGVGRVFISEDSNFRIGQKVLIANSGTWQKYVDVDAVNLFKIPESLSNGYSAQLYINALTAWVMTTQIAKLNQEDILIINAGNSAIGNIFSQLSKTVGFRLLVVTSKPALHQYNANFVLSSNKNLNRQLQKNNIPTPTIAFDAIGGSEGMKLLQTLKLDSRYIVYGSLSLEYYTKAFFNYQKTHQIEFNTFFLRSWEKQVGEEKRAIEFYKMLEHFITNDIQLAVDSYMPIEKYQDAITRSLQQNGPLKGKVIMTIE